MFAIKEHDEYSQHIIFSQADYAKAVLNILEDSATERMRLEDTQRAVVNILEDAARRCAEFCVNGFSFR